MKTTTNQWMRSRIFGRNTKDAKKLRKRTLGFETMETRELMSVNPLVPALAPWSDAVVCRGDHADTTGNEVQESTGEGMITPSAKIKSWDNSKITAEIFSGLFYANNPQKLPSGHKANLSTKIDFKGNTIKIGNVNVEANKAGREVTFTVEIDGEKFTVTGKLQMLQTKAQLNGKEGTATTYVFTFQDPSKKTVGIVYTDTKGDKFAKFRIQHNNAMKAINGKSSCIFDAEIHKGTGIRQFRENTQSVKFSAPAPANGGVETAFSQHAMGFREAFSPFTTDFAGNALENAIPRFHVKTDPTAPAALPNGGLQMQWTPTGALTAAVTDQALAQLFAD